MSSEATHVIVIMLLILICTKLSFDAIILGSICVYMAQLKWQK
jgi:hypothetical protein